jgi:hypothetical protein
LKKGLQKQVKRIDFNIGMPHEETQIEIPQQQTQVVVGMSRERTQADILPTNFNKELRIVKPLQGRTDYSMWGSNGDKSS